MPGDNLIPTPNLHKKLNLSSCNPDLLPEETNNVGHSVTPTTTTTNSTTPQLNSYKFPRPRIYIKNTFESHFDPLQSLHYLSTTIGPKSRPHQYNQYIDRLLQLSNPSKPKFLKNTPVSINVTTTTPMNIKTIRLTIQSQPITALVDTGATHNLISTDLFQSLKNSPFTPLQMNMKVAGNTLKDNIIGHTTLITTFHTDKPQTKSPIEFLIAHALNGYQCIIGAQLLFDQFTISALTPTHLHFSPNFNNAITPLHPVAMHPELNFLQCTLQTVLQPNKSHTITTKATIPDNFTIYTPKPINPMLKITTFHQSDSDIQCTIRNTSEKNITLQENQIIATLPPKNHIQLMAAQLNSSLPTSKPEHTNIAQPLISEHNIDEEIISEHILIDPTTLDKKFTHKDCEINPKIPHHIKTQLEKIIQDNKNTFATSKLDVGMFPKFMVKLEIDSHITPEKKRFMSEEKIAYCEKTFAEFTKLNLIQECHTPHTVSNLLLVPKYEGLRDLTKASTYLAQINGTKNTQFRIVQDLRRINTATKNIKKAMPKLPEMIFQKLKNKIVSSLDANQAYWHLVLHPDSRPYTCFYLNNKIMQFNRMPQGLASAPACWDQAMSLIFSPETLQTIKSKLPEHEKSLVPNTFDDFFIFYQDDSWIFSDTPETHLIHLKVVLMAYNMHNIKLSPTKCTFFPDTFKILGVSISPLQSELALDQIKAQSILDWEKPDSLYTLQSRLYALNYWSKFIPNLAEIKFPLNQILRSQIFTWNEDADQAWNNIKSLIALDIRLTIPEQHEKLLITTDASKIACSAILWVFRDGNLKVVGCHSKLFSHTDSLKSIYFKETYALIAAFQHFRPYLLNTKHPITVFTDARSLIWVGRNREYQIACNGLANKLAKIQLEIPHTIYSVPSETNYLADIFSRAFHNSRFLDKSKYSLSKIQAQTLPPLTDPFLADEKTLHQFFSQPLTPEHSDPYPRNKPKISTPKPIKNLYAMFENCTPEEKYYSALRLLHGWNDPNIKNTKNTQLNSTENTPPELDPTKVLEKHKILKTYYEDTVLKNTMDQFYSNLDIPQKARLKATLQDNFKKLLTQNMKNTLKDTFIDQETLLNTLKITQPAPEPSTDLINTDKNTIQVTHNQLKTQVYYSLQPPFKIHPKIGHNSAGIDLPIPTNTKINPSEHKIINTGIKFYIPANYYMQILPRSSSFKLNIYIHHGAIDNDYNDTVKLLIRNTSTNTVKLEAGTAVAQAFIIPTLHPELLQKDDITINSTRNTQAFGSSDTPKHTKIYLTETQPSPLHTILNETQPPAITVPQLNISITLPTDTETHQAITHEINTFNIHQNHQNLHDITPPITHPTQCPQTEIIHLTRDFIDKTAYINSIINTKTQKNPSPQNTHDIKDEIYNQICQKLAVISIDLIKNQYITKNLLARTQQSDDYLSIIRDDIYNKHNNFPNFEIKQQVLYKKIPTPLKITKYVICIPDILLPSVIHTLHINLGHPSYTTTIKNFNMYYYHRYATKHIKNYVQSCTTCALASKYDIQKIDKSTDRTMQPTRPRQHIYADLIPMYKGPLSYILFALDAYSQYIYAIPIPDKTHTSVLQGFLALFSTTGWPEILYLDNETSFIKTAKQLIKIAPMKIIYSTPYCHFQNSSENYIKNFKKVFLKTLNDQENPQENTDWPLLLPTVTQALNRQIIPLLGISRDTLHFNTFANFQPLANISEEENTRFHSQVTQKNPNFFKIILENRKKAHKYSKKHTVPIFHETQIVFIRDQTPANSTILKIPQKGPYRIEKLEARNVTLTELETGNTVHSHVEHIRPLLLSEYRLLLKHNWDLNAHVQKHTKTKTHQSILDTPTHPHSLEHIKHIENTPEDIEDEIDLETLEYPRPLNTPDKTHITDPEPEPPDLPEIPSKTQNFEPEINTLHAHLDLSKKFRNTLQNNTNRLVTFFLSKHDQYIHKQNTEAEID